MTLSEIAEYGVGSFLTQGLSRKLGITVEDMLSTFSKGDAEGSVSFLNSEIMALMYTLTISGKTVEDFEKAFDDSESMGDFLTKLQEINKALNGDDGSGGQTPKTAKEYVSDITAAVTEIEKMQSIIDSIKKDGTYDMKDLFGLAETHPE